MFNSATIPNAEELAREALVEARVVTGPAKHGRIQVLTYSQGTGLRDKEGGEVTTFDHFLRKLLDGEIYPTARVVIYADNKFLNKMNYSMFEDFAIQRTSYALQRFVIPFTKSSQGDSILYAKRELRTLIRVIIIVCY